MNERSALVIKLLFSAGVICLLTQGVLCYCGKADAAGFSRLVESTVYSIFGGLLALVGGKK